MAGQPRVVILGAGAAGLMAAHEAAVRGRAVTVVDSQAQPGRKLAITGGGMCNVTNTEVLPGCFLGANPHFVKSALARFSMWDTTSLLAELGITTHERERGELFCDQRASILAEKLHARAAGAGARFQLGCTVKMVTARPEGGFQVHSSRGPLDADRVIVATGGLSYASVGASSIGHDIARSLGIPMLPPRPGLAPLQWSAADRERFGGLSGNALEVVAHCHGSPLFRANMLFSHRGLSGPAILQVSSYWKPGQPITIDLLPGVDVEAELHRARTRRPRVSLRNIVSRWLPRRLVETLQEREIPRLRLGQLSNAQARAVHRTLRAWSVLPSGTAGYPTAEVTVGGVDTRVLSSKTLEARDVPGLHFVGEVLDVTGWLGGYNLQWAWSSGWCAGRSV